MHTTISAKEMRLTLPEVVRRVRRGARYTVIYRSRPAFDLVPVGGVDATSNVAEKPDILYQAGPVGRSRDGKAATDHDAALYR
jgi:antitoxin (DNA-binding transcriptional repressor) of toxin-antitoxin stability system